MTHATPRRLPPISKRATAAGLATAIAAMFVLLQARLYLGYETYDWWKDTWTALLGAATPLIGAGVRALYREHLAHWLGNGADDQPNESNDAGAGQ